MRNGDANGCPPLPADDVAARLEEDADGRVRAFPRARRRAASDTAIDPYAAEIPAEFFAVLSEVFFADPTLLRHEYPRVYQQFVRFYRQDPAARTELLLDG